MDLNKKVDKLLFTGTSEKLKDGSFILEGVLEGSVDVECIKCLEEFEKPIKEELKLKIVKPPFDGFDEDYDIIEMEKFDIEEIIKSEIELIKNDYNICSKCKDIELNKEF